MEDVPFEDRHVPQAEIAWERSAWWWYPLTRSIHPAIKLTTLVLSLVALWFTKAGIYLGNLAFAPQNSDGQPWSESGSVWFSQFDFPSSPFSSPIVVWIGSIVQAVVDLRFGLREVAFVSFVALWVTAVVAILGGVLARRSLVELGQRTIAPWGDSFKIVVTRWQAYLWATGMHFVGLASLLLPIAVLGLLSQLGSAGANVAGVLLLLYFPFVFAIGRLMLSFLFCFPLSVCAIAAEKRADAFEGFSRSNAYLFQRPVVAAICVFLLLLIGLIGEQMVMWTLYFGWGLVRSVYLLSGGLVESASNTYILLGNSLCRELLVAYWFSFFWAGSAATYLILRRSVDSTLLDELDEVEALAAKSLPEIPRSAAESSDSKATPNSAVDSQTAEESASAAKSEAPTEKTEP
ncbi:MAG: hypothetical protein AB8B50_13590 [Pirellulaceae bacterium]